jgi:hypothetical protein
MPAGKCGRGCDLGSRRRITDQPAVAERAGVHVEGIAEIRRTDACIADLTEVRTTMSRSGCEPHPAMMPATAMRVPEAMTAEMAAAMMTTTTMMPTTVTTSVPTAMSSAMSSAALPQSCACQHAGKHHHGNSNDRSQHRILPREAAPLRHRKLTGIGTGVVGESSVTAMRQLRATPPARSCRG